MSNNSFYRVFSALRDAFEAEAPGIGKIITAEEEEGFIRIWIGGELVRVEVPTYEKEAA